MIRELTKDQELLSTRCEPATPEDAEELRARYDGIRPAWHMNKRLWNDVYFNQDVPDDVIFQLVHNSYDLIVAKLTKREREELFHL